MRAQWIFGMLLVAATFAAAPAQAAPPDGSTAIFLTNEVLSKVTAPDAVAQCGETPTYAITADLPVGTEASKAYTAGSAVAVSCGARFTYAATQPFQLSGTATLHLFIGCDVPTVFRTGEAADGGPVPPTSVRASLFKNGGEISRDALYFPPPPVCVPGDVIEVELMLPTGDTEFEAGDSLILEIPVFSSNPYQAADNVHVLVGTMAAPSALHALGLPGGGAAGPAPVVESFVLDGAGSLAVEAGSSASLDLSLENAGAANASFNLSVASVPAGLSISFEPASGEIGPGAAADVTMGVDASDDAEPGAYNLVVLATGPGGGKATLNVTMEVAEAGGSGGGSGADPGDPPEAGPGDDSSNDTTDGNETDGAVAADFGSEAPGLSVAMTGVALAATVVFAVRRRRQG